MLLSSIIIFVPIQYSINAKGVLYPKDFTTIYATDNGYLSKIYLKSGEFIKKGELIASLDSYELDLDILMTEAKIKETKALQLKAYKNIADLSPLKRRLKTLENKLLWQQKRKDNLIIYAPISGVWVANGLKKLKDSIIKKRDTMGYIIPDNGFEFKAVVPQEMAFDLFKMSKLNGDIKLNGIPSKTIKSNSIYVIPYEQHKLPSSALGWFGGGDIKVSQADSTGTTSIEAFFEIRADIIKDVNNPMLLHNRVGILKIVLPKKPLGEQIYKSIQQIMRKRYTL
jgi:putative peptide zinc metalloprotease protein